MNIDPSIMGCTNKIHSAEEEAYIRDVWSTSECLLQEMECKGQIADENLAQKQSLLDLISRCRIALAPHKRLPPDILRSIFLELCSNARIWFPPKSRQGLDILSIIQVCSAWRQLAFETPRLWNDIRITLMDGLRIGTRLPREHDKTITFATEWFARAKDIPRSLSIELHLERYTHVVWNQLLDFIAAFPLRNLALHTITSTPPLTLPSSTWSSIEDLKLFAFGPVTFSKEMTLTNLRRLSLHTEPGQLSEMQHVIPWHQLQSLMMPTMRISLSLCLNVLRQSPLLEYGNLAVSSEPSTATSLSEDYVTLNNLGVLNLSVKNDTTLDAFLRLLVVPNITTLTFHGIKGYNASSLSHFIQRSGNMPKIRTLFFSDQSAELISAGILLELLPSLGSLDLPFGFLTEYDMNRLSSGKIGPRLHTLNLYPDDRHDANLVLSMVEERNRNASKNPEIDGFCPFESIQIQCIANEDQKRQIDEAIAFREKYGVELKLRFPSPP